MAEIVRMLSRSSGETTEDNSVERLSNWLELVQADGIWAVHRPPFCPIPLTDKGRPIIRFPQPCRPRGIYAGFSPTYVLDLGEENGCSAFWILDASFNVIFKYPEAGSPQADLEIAQDISAPLTRLASRLLVDPRGVVDHEICAYFCLSRAVRLKLLDWFPLKLTAPALIDLATTQDDHWSFEISAGEYKTLAASDVMSVMHRDLAAEFIAGFESGSLRWRSICSESMLNEVRCIFSQYNTAFIRCIESSGIIFYVLLWGPDLRPVAIYVPKANIIFGYSKGVQALYIRQLRCGTISVANSLALQLLQSGSALLDWLEADIKCRGTFFWPDEASHLGHYIWNELSGLEKLCSDIVDTKYPSIFILSRNEFYGPIEDIFPEFSHLINRSFSTIDQLQEYSYRVQIQVVRFSGNFVSSTLQNRLSVAVLRDADVNLLRQSIGYTSHDFALTERFVVLGLRLTDRTHADLIDFYRAVIRRLRNIESRLGIVVDGLNSQPGAPSGTAFLISGRRVPDAVATELRASEDLCGFANTLGIKAISCVSSSMRLNLFWIAHAQMFIAPWGGGLAKYRWVCNKPGIVLTNRANLLRPAQLPIYDDPAFMDEPAPMEFVKPDNVIDIRDSGEELGVDGLDTAQRRGALSPVKFKLNMAAVLDQIEEFYLRIRN